MRSSLVPVLVLAALAAACSRKPADPALVENPAPLTDCSDAAFVTILGGGQAVECRGLREDAAVRACVEAPFTKRAPYAHVEERPGQPRLITVLTPEKKVYQVRRFQDPDGDERVDLFSCRAAPEMPRDDMPYFCPMPIESIAPVARGQACQVLERARTLRRLSAEKAGR